MFMLFPGFALFVYGFLAVIPALVMLLYIYRQDRVEHEPFTLLVRLIMAGVAAASLSGLLESVGEKALSLFDLDPASPLYLILLSFLVVAVVEEGMKYLLLYRRTWNDPNFNFRFDGIVYAVFVSLGFAAMENIMYVFGYGLSVVVSRAFLSIPGHMGFSVVFGIFYGRAKMYANAWRPEKSKRNLVTGYLLSVILHGLYDACAMIGTGFSLAIFTVLIVVLYIIIFRIVRKEAATDIPI